MAQYGSAGDPLAGGSGTPVAEGEMVLVYQSQDPSIPPKQVPASDAAVYGLEYDQTVTTVNGQVLYQFGEAVNPQAVGSAGGSMGGGGGMGSSAQPAASAPPGEYVDEISSSHHQLPPHYFGTVNLDANGNVTPGRLVQQDPRAMQMEGSFSNSPINTETGEATGGSSGGSSGGSTWVDYSGRRRGGSYGGSSYGGSSGGGGGYPSFGPDDAMRGAGLDARNMGFALRDWMGAPQPHMPGGGGDDDPPPAPSRYIAPTHPSGAIPPWPGAGRTGLYGGGGGGSGGYSGGAPSLDSARARIQAAMGSAGFGGGGSGGYSSGGYAPGYGEPPPAPGSASGGQPPTERMKGFARREGYTAPMIQDVLAYRPYLVIEDSLGLKPSDPMYQAMKAMPVDPNAVMMMGPGATRKNWTPGASATANFYDRYYRDLAGGGQLDPGEMTDNLLDPRKGSALDMQMKSSTPGENMYTLSQYFQSVSNAMPPAVGAAYQGYFDSALDSYGNKVLSKNPKNVPEVGRFLNKRFF